MRTLRHWLAFATLALFAFSTAALAQRGQPPATMITGTLLGSDGAPMKLAHVHLLDTRTMRTIARGQAEADGKFALATTRTGVFQLQFTGVDHYSAMVPLVALAHTTLVVNARLRHYAYRDSLDNITAVGDWGHFSFANPTPLVRQSDGRYTATVPVDSAADSVAYELLGLEASQGRSINGTASDRWIYDEGGDYKSVIAAHGGSATIVFDPSKIERPAAEGDTLSIVFGDPGSEASRLADLWRSWEAEQGHWQDSLSAAVRRREAVTRVNYDVAPWVAGRAAMLARERSALARQLIALQILRMREMGGKVDAALARRITREMQPASPWFSFFQLGGPGSVEVAYALGSAAPPRAEGDTTPVHADTAALRASAAFLNRVAAEHADSVVRKGAHNVASGLERTLGDPKMADRLWAQLTTRDPESPQLAVMRVMYSPNRVWQAGRDAPAFQFQALDDTTVIYTPASFAGKVVLVDFWATWCGPCVEEMQYLQAAYDSLAPRGLQMLSISLDNARDSVRAFRARQWKMPWLQAFATGGFSSDQLTRLEIMMIPRVFLIGRDGKVLATDNDLRGDRLLPTLRRLMETPATPAQQ